MENKSATLEKELAQCQRKALRDLLDLSKLKANLHEVQLRDLKECTSIQDSQKSEGFRLQMEALKLAIQEKQDKIVADQKRIQELEATLINWYRQQ
jgi:hypothetical protein